MGNTNSSMGVFFGSVIGGIILGPITGGASIVAATTLAGAGIGATTAVINSARNEHGDENDLITGAVCGAIGPLCGGASTLGANVTYSAGIGVGGQILGVGFISNETTGNKPKNFIGNSEVVKREQEIKYYEEIANKLIIREKEMMKMTPAKVMSTPTFINRSKIMLIPNITKNDNIVYNVYKTINAMSFMYMKQNIKEKETKKPEYVKIFEIFVHYVNVIGSIGEIAQHNLEMVGPAIQYYDKNLHDNMDLLINSVINLIKTEKRLTPIQEKIERLEKEIKQLNKTEKIINECLNDVINNILYY